MIYLISRNETLFKSEHYTKVPFETAMEFLWTLKQVQFDTETTGLDPYTKQLLTIQLGNKQCQCVFDWLTLNSIEKAELKRYLESGVLLIGWNLLFDLGFLYVNDIWPTNIYDGMIAEQLLYLGYSPEEHPMSLKAAAMFYLNYDLDKSVRGKIINVGLTEEVVVYAAGDVMWMEDIKEKQEEQVAIQQLEKALQIEFRFIPALAYFKHCGVKLDVGKWTEKMKRDDEIVESSLASLNNWVEKWCEDNPDKQYDLQYVDTYDKSFTEVQDLQREWLNKGYARFPKADATGPCMKLIAFRKPYNFVALNLQGDLFSPTGYDPNPHCAINWNSKQQIVPFFNLLGIKTRVWDNKKKKEDDSIEEGVLKPQAKDFPILQYYLAYKKAAKLASTYGQNWIDAINPVTGRIHVEFHSIGTDTARVSSGGGVYKLNLQNLPHDKFTRSCFVADSGNKWISADYRSQESRIIASVSQDDAMIELFEHGCGDVHSLVAKMSYPNIIPAETRIEDIGDLYHDQRQDAKGIEFAINYGGDANTIANNKGIPLAEAEEIYNNFMKGFPGVKQYQDYARMAVMRDGYILMNPQTRHRCHIPNWEFMANMQQKMKHHEFWDYYRDMKKSNPSCDTVKNVQDYFKQKSQLEKNSINYRIQNRGAMCFKLSAIILFNWIRDNHYLNKVKMCVPVHDEFNLECPEDISQNVADVLVRCMIAGGKPFCTNVFLGADVNINNFWVH